MTARRRVEAVVVGAGLMGRWHADAARAAGASIVAVVDRDTGRAHRLARRFAGCGAHADLDSVLARRPQVVHLCTPTATHDALTRAAIEAGCHVLVEKPLASTAETTRQLLADAAARGVQLCPVHQFLFQRGVLRACSLVPRLGRLRHVDFVTCSAGADRLPQADRDRVALEILPHPLALFVRILGAAMADAEYHVAHPEAGELRVAAVAGGVTAGILISMGGRPPRNLLRLTAEHGTIQADLFHGFAVLEQGRVSRGQKILRPLVSSAATLWAASINLGRRAVQGEYAYPGLRELVRRFYLAVDGNSPTPIPFAETEAVAVAFDRVLDRIVMHSRP